MIFIILFAFIFLVVTGLSFYDDHNHSKIEEYLKTNGCKTKSYFEGRYKAICKESIIIINNSFVIDLDESLMIPLKEIALIEKSIKEKTAVSSEKNFIKIIKRDKKEEILKFKTVDELKIFENELRQRIL